MVRIWHIVHVVAEFAKRLVFLPQEMSEIRSFEAPSMCPCGSITAHVLYTDPACLNVDIAS